jgi:parallel beta-helix repeat protein
MRNKLVSGAVILFLLAIVLSAAVFIQPTEAAGGTIYINVDGSIDPLTAPILSVDNITYTFTGNIYDSIVVERNNIVIDGNEYLLQGAGSGTGIDIYDRENVTVQNIQIKSFNHGIDLSHSENCFIVSNKITLNERGIDLSVSNYISIRGNNIENNNFGIRSAYCDYNTMRENNITSNIQEGVYISFSYNNSISRNNVTNNYWGVYFHDSHFNSVQRNNVTNNEYGFEVASSTDNSISENRITNNQYGIWISHSSNNSVSGNNIENNYEGVFTLYSESTFNRIIGNNVTNNQKGIKIKSFSNYNTVSGNNITSNTQGIWISDSFDNTIYNNNFVNNSAHAYSSNSINIWDNGYPSGGNYWSDYTGNDSDGDGIGDTPYVIDENNQDNYPLVALICRFDAGTWEQTQYFFDCVSNSTVSDFYFDPTEGAFLLFNVEGENGTSGFCRVTIPKNLLTAEDDWTVLVDGASVTPTVNEDASNTYLYFTYQHSTKTIEIRGITVIPEFQSWTLTLFTLTALAVAVAIYMLKPPKN